MRLLEIDEQHANLAIPHQVAHRIEHAVAVVAGKRDRLIVKNANKPWVAALIGHSRSALVIDSREEKHIPTFDERLHINHSCGALPIAKKLDCFNGAVCTCARSGLAANTSERVDIFSAPPHIGPA